MGSKNKLAELLKARNPLSQPREAVKPVNLYTSTQVDNEAKPAQEDTKSIQVDKPTSVQVHNPTNPQEDKPTSTQTGKPTNPLVRKYTTHLPPETIKAIKRYAFDNDRKDYEVVKEALEEYLKARS